VTPNEPLGEQADVEAQLCRPQINRLHLGAQQVDQQCPEPCLIEQLRHIATVRAEATTAAAVSKQADAADALGWAQISREQRRTRGEADQTLFAI
jgi:hypothetical protein